MKRVAIVCDVCKEPITEIPCTPHVTHALDDDSGNIHYHPECCPDCQAEDDAAEDAAWREFVANEYAAEAAERLGL